MSNISILRGGGHGLPGLPTLCPSRPRCPAYLSLPSSFYLRPFPPLTPFIPPALFRPSANPSCHHRAPQLPCAAPCPESASQGALLYCERGTECQQPRVVYGQRDLNAANHSTSRFHSPIGCRRTP